ncbi:uncharacterized protein METZ01_LOCUS351998 [marine metagenome]|uniref:Uncharacterized protein n=1 Tax=marine metagenome TaxID=408172 RepID=A0A382RN64_9ZZZZ
MTVSDPGLFKKKEALINDSEVDGSILHQLRTDFCTGRGWFRQLPVMRFDILDH